MKLWFILCILYDLYSSRSLQNMAQHLGVMEHKRAAPNKPMGIYDVDLYVDIDMIVLYMGRGGLLESFKQVCMFCDND